MFKLHVTHKVIKENGEVVVYLTPITSDSAIMISGSLTITTSIDNFTVGKDYDSSLQEVI